jgi:uncharacterized membrane protein
MPAATDAAETTTQGTETAAGTARLIGFNDGVIAVAITLLVLDIRLPDRPPPRQ